MAAPTRAEITATIALPTFTIEIDQGAGYVAVTDSEVRSIDTKLETTSNVDNGFAFGTVARSSASVEVADTTVITTWQLAKIRIKYGFASSDQIVAFEGVIIKRQHAGHFYTYECAGFDYIIERKKVYTDVLYRRPIATKTTVTSIENIADSDYRGGLLNYIMWISGGRPYEQPSLSTDPDFMFWYSFDQSIITPRYSWLSGDNAWEEAYKLVRAAGGQFYQDVDGVFYYKQPLTFGYTTGATLYHFSESTYQTLTEDASTAENVDTIKSAFIERTVQPLQQVYESTTPHLLAIDAVYPTNLEMQYPVYQYAGYIAEGTMLDNKDATRATFLDGRDATLDDDLSYSTLEIAAQLVTLQFTNATGEPISLNKITLQGRPVTAGSEGIVSYSTGNGPELQLEDSVYIQSFAQAYRSVRMVYDFYHENRAIVLLEGVGYDPDRYLGEVVEISNTAWGLSNAEHRIISLEYQNGAKMSVRLAPIEGLVTRNDVFIVGTTYSDADVRLVSY